MAKGQRRSNREAKKPKKTVLERSTEKSKNAAGAITGPLSSRPASTSYKDRFK